jgi:hypothetical protein
MGGDEGKGKGAEKEGKGGGGDEWEGDKVMIVGGKGS